MSVFYEVAIQQVVENMLEHQLDGTLVHMWISVHLILLFFSLFVFFFHYKKKKKKKKKKIELNFVVSIM